MGEGWFKLNIDGASKSNPGAAGIGGVIMNHKGDFIAAFAKNIGIATNNKAEVWALVQGLKIAAQMERSRIIIDTDSMFLLSCFNRKEVPLSSLEALILEATHLLKGMEKVLLRFSYRETNSVADFLAKMGSNLRAEEERVFDNLDKCFSN